MAPFSLFVTAALLALTGVDAAKDKVRIFQFTDPSCNGHPVGKQFEIKRDECRTIDATAVKIQRPKKNKDLKWLDFVNKGHQECFVVVYGQPGCPDNAERDEFRRISVPVDFEKCSSDFEVPSKDPYHPARSVKFQCAPPGRYGALYNVTQTLYVTAYTMDAWNTPHASVYTTTVTAPRWSYPPPGPSLEPRVEQSIKPHVEARGTHWNKKGVWLKHAWAGGEECFECWTKKASLTSDFECEAGPKTSIDCGPRPADDPKFWTTTSPTTAVGMVTTTHIKTVVKVIDSTTTSYITANASTPNMQERSEKKYVKFDHPFIAGDKTCAKAKWHHAGDSRKQRIEIKGPKKCHTGKKANQDWPIDIRYTSQATTAASTSIVTVTEANTITTSVGEGFNVFTGPAA
ncbi:hypothetical protein K505DRAFT_361134 [Melanomma pulvis-pyrius CBS 109.77]|uniref:Lytic polysaccharide monooxygenase n=1 Tax=Melanomma pulvis-pyrius CBS 109.77 TaxID=1314802 RepID=A0A6A6XEN8_9PLEO|nr:hypothetical protein K505DRAFT_361134 [Melanomma pulvis-pyrius CBS 109.77]